MARRVNEVRLEAPGHSFRIPLDAPLSIVPRVELARWQLERAMAAGFADPVTGEGIRNALRSAACLADAYRSDGTFAGYPDRAEATFEPGFRLSRRTHALLYDARAAAWLVGAAARNRFMEAFAAAVSNGGNEHELWGTLLDRWRTAYRRTRAA